MANKSVNEEIDFWIDRSTKFEVQLSAALEIAKAAKAFNHNDDNCSICQTLKIYESQYGELK